MKRIGVPPAVFLFAAMLSGGCNGHEPSPGEVGGACFGGEFCPAPLTCASEICVDLGDGSTEGGADGPASRPDDDDDDDEPGRGGEPYTSGGGVPPDEDEPAASVPVCEVDMAAALCRCSHRLEEAPIGSCDPQTVGTPSVCCATDDWPTDGSCNCNRAKCIAANSGGWCACLPVSADPIDPGRQEVQGCSAQGGVCCRDYAGPYGFPGTCTCYPNASACPSDADEQVTSCTVEDIQCGNNRRVGTCT